MLTRLASFVITILFFMNLSIPSANAAEGFPVEKFPYKEMQIQVMPEFDYPEKWPEDQPSLLLGYYGTFTNKTGKDFSGEIEFPAPINDKNFEVYLVAEFPNETDPEVQRAFEVNKEKGVITWKPAEPIKKDKTYSFVVEYYTNPFEVKDTKKFDFNYVNIADTEKLDVILYAPLESKDFKVEPQATTTTDSEYGQKLHVYQYTNKKKGDAVNISATYVKKDNKSTLSLMSEKTPPNDENHSGTSATEQVTNGTGKGKSSDQPIIGIGGATVIGLSIIIAGVFVFLGLKGNARSKQSGVKAKKTPGKKPMVEKQPQKSSKNNNLDQKKRLRTMLINGEIDNETYEKEVEKLG